MYTNASLLAIRNATKQQTKLTSLTDVHYLPDVFSGEEVRQLFSASNGAPVCEAGVSNFSANTQTIIRTGSVSFLELRNKIFELVAQRLLEIARLLNVESWNFNVHNQIEEDLQLSTYADTNSDFYDWHLDIGNSFPSCNRKISLVCGLQTAVEGGEFAVSLGPSNYQVKILPGDLLAFPSFMQSKVYPVRKGKMVALQAWVAGAPFS